MREAPSIRAVRISRAVALAAGLVLATVALGGGPAGTASAGTAARATAPAPPPVSSMLGAGARLVGSGTMRWLGLAIYDARLWAGAGEFRATSFAEQPFVLELAYRRTLEGAAIARASDERMARLGAPEGARSGWLAAMRRLFPDVTAGDRIAGAWMPGRGAEFFLDDRSLGRIDDPAFGAAFFGIWLDERTTEPALRAALIGRASDAGR